MPSGPGTEERFFRYRLHLEDGSDAGEATYAQMIHPGDEIHLGAGRRFRVLDVVPFEEGGRVAVRRAATDRGGVMDEEDTQPSEEEIAAHRDDGYRAVGRYVVVFSQMLQEMRLQMAVRLQDTATYGGRESAREICKAFFGICQQLGTHDPDEAKTAVRLRELVMQEIAKRDEVAHAEWIPGAWAKTGLEEGGMSPSEPVPPHGYRTSKAGEFFLVDDDLDARSDEIERLTKLLREYGRVCFGMHPLQFDEKTQRVNEKALRVSDVVRLEHGRLVLGPKALVFPRDPV